MLKEGQWGAIALSLVACVQASAADQQPWIGFGAGAVTCGKYLEQRGAGERGDALWQWYAGYVTARNYYAGDGQSKTLTERETLVAYADKYCRDHPLASVTAGLLDLANKMARAD